MDFTISLSMNHRYLFGAGNNYMVNITEPHHFLLIAEKVCTSIAHHLSLSF